MRIVGVFMKLVILISLFLLAISGCSPEKDNTNSKELWIYTSMYKDTISDLTPRLEKAFPGVKFRWYQAGSEDIATKVNAEILAGNLKADILISSDRFWYEEMASMKHLHSYRPKAGKSVADTLKHPGGFYSTVSIKN